MPYKNVSEQEIMTRERKIKLRPGATIYTVEEKENYKKIKENASISQQIHIDSFNHGGFTFLKTVNNAMEKMKPETVGRLVYLSTYLDFGSDRLMAEPNRPMKKNDLQYFLGISKTRVWNFCDECIEQGIMIVDDEKIVHLDNIFFKGKSSDRNRIKLYSKTIQSLYKQMSARVDVLDKVKELFLLPQLEMMTVQQVADYYEVDNEAVQKCYRRNKEEVDSDGTALKKLDFWNGHFVQVKNNIRGSTSFKISDDITLVVPNGGIRLFSKRAVLRIGMLLRDSRVAREVRTQLLNAFEKTNDFQKIEDIETEQEAMGEMGLAFIAGDYHQVAGTDL